MTNRWAAATAVTAAAAAGAWALCQLAFRLQPEAAIGAATLVLALVGAPLGHWASKAHDEPGLGAAAKLPKVSNLGPRNPSFVGREEELNTLQARLKSGGAVVVQAVYGVGGIGKTALAGEYAHRNVSAYDIIWWVDAEQASLIGDQLGRLAIAAKWVPPDADATTAIVAVRHQLGQATRWLIIFDNASSPSELRPWLSLGRGHVVVTSRSPGWDQVARKVEVEKFSRAESIDFVTRVVPRLTPAVADQIAHRTGDLPLALAQAAGVLAETGMAPDMYLDELYRHADAVMSERAPDSYSVPLAAALRISVGKLEEREPAALSLLRVCIPMAPEPVPLDLIFPVPDGLVSDPGLNGASRFEVMTRAGRLVSFGLARSGPDGLELHRMTQAVLLDQLDAAERERLVIEAERLLVNAAPETTDDISEWPKWSRLLPHIIALDPAISERDELRELATDAVRYLLNRGDAQAGYQLAEGLVENWHGRYGDSDKIALAAAFHLARALRELGKHEDAVELAEGVMERYRQLDGADSPAALAAATGFAASLRALGRVEEALALDLDALSRKERVLPGGRDNPSTLTSATGVASDLRQLARFAEAEVRDRDALARKRAILGDDALSTLISMENLAADLRMLKRIKEVVALQGEFFERAQHVLGSTHPTTRRAGKGLAQDLRAAGDSKRAAEVERLL